MLKIKRSTDFVYVEVSGMLKAKEGIGTKIKVVKQWLNSAEDSFANDNAVRGHLDLMLAEAEMKHLRTGTESILQKKYKELACLLTVCLVATFAYWHFTKQEKIVNIVDKSINVERGLLNSEKTLEQKSITPTSVTRQEQGQETSIESRRDTKEQPVKLQSVEQKPTKEFSEQEKQALIRQAQKSLQGYNKNIGGL